MSKCITFILSLFFLYPNLAGASKLNLNLNEKGWNYIYLTEVLGEIHLIEEAKNQAHKGYLKRTISVLKPDEVYANEDFMKKKCPKLSDDMAVSFDKKNHFCIQIWTMGNKKTTLVSFPTKRSGGVKRSYFWNTLSFVDVESLDQDLLIDLRNQLEESNS